MFRKNIRRYLVTGLVVLLPVFLTINILFITIKFFDGILGQYIRPFLERTYGISFFGVGLVAILLLIFATGVLASNVFIKRMIPFFERIFLRFPIVTQLYPSLKQLVGFLFSDEKIAFKKVAIFEYPRKGIYTMGFVTNEFDLHEAQEGVDSVCVYIASAPNPITGFFVIVPRAEVIYLDISIEEAFKIIISGGVLLQNEALQGKIPASALAGAGGGDGKQPAKDNGSDA